MRCNGPPLCGRVKSLSLGKWNGLMAEQSPAQVIEKAVLCVMTSARLELRCAACDTRASEACRPSYIVVRMVATDERCVPKAANSSIVENH